MTITGLSTIKDNQIYYDFQALVATKLYKSMAHEAAQDELEMDISEELRSNAK